MALNKFSVAADLDYSTFALVHLLTRISKLISAYFYNSFKNAIKIGNKILNTITDLGNVTMQRLLFLKDKCLID